MAISDTQFNALYSILGGTPKSAAGGSTPATPALNPQPVSPTTTSQNGSYSPLNPSTVAQPSQPQPVKMVQPPVITSSAARQDFNNIKADYQNIKAGVQNQSQINQQANQANAAVPTLEGYTMSTTPNNGEGVVKITSNGQTYYGTPLTNKAPSAEEIAKQYGQTPEDVAAFKAANPGLNYTAEDAQYAQQAENEPYNIYLKNLQNISDTEVDENNDYQRKLSQSNTDLNNAYNDFKTKLDQLQQGTFPLSNAQQALIDSTKQSFDQAVQQTDLRAAALSSQTGGFSNKVSAALGAISSIDAQKAATLARLELGFQETNYKMISDAYTEFKQLEADKTNRIKELHQETVTTLDNMRKTASEQKKSLDEANKQANESLLGTLLIDPTLSVDDKRKAISQAASKGILSFEQVQKAQEELRKQEEKPDKYAAGVVGEYQFYAEQERAAGRHPMSFFDFKNYDSSGSGTGGGSLANQINPATGLAYTKAEQEAIDQAQKQDALDLQTVNSAYTSIEGVLRKYDATPDTFNATYADKMTDIDAETIAKALARIQNPDIARAGGDTGNALAPGSFTEQFKQSYREKTTGKKYLPEKIVEAVSGAKAIRDERKSRVDNPLAARMNTNEDIAQNKIYDYVLKNPDQKETVAKLMETPLPAFGNKPPTHLQALEYLRTKGAIQ